MGQIEQVLGRSVSAYRRRIGITQAQLAERVGVSVETIGRLETGAAVPSLARLDDIACALGVGVHVLLRSCQSDSARDAALDRLIHAVADCTVAEIDLVSAITRDLLDHLRKAPPDSRGAGSLEQDCVRPAPDVGMPRAPT